MEIKNFYAPWKQVVKKFVPKSILSLRRILQGLSNPFEFKCPICGFTGKFGAAGIPVRVGVLCSSCGSLERHRLFFLRLQKMQIRQPVLHFAPEACLSKNLRPHYNDYVTADYSAETDLKLNIEEIDFDSDSFHSVICNHVLEHVDDVKALKEIRRILSAGGQLIASVPMIGNLKTSFRPEGDWSSLDRRKLFGQADHMRLYGSDFKEFVEEQGFECVNVWVPEIQEYYDFSLNYDDVIYQFRVKK